MAATIDHNQVEAALNRAGSSWSAAQAHGLLCGRISVAGASGASEWLGIVLENSDAANALHHEQAQELSDVAVETYRRLSERQSEFVPLLPDVSEPMGAITSGMAEWCEGYLHGLVSQVHDQPLKDKLAAEPISDIIKDLLEITRADVDEDDDEDANEEALTELVEYLRVTTQLIYEELSAFRRELSPEGDSGPDAVH